MQHMNTAMAIIQSHEQFYDLAAAQPKGVGAGGAAWGPSLEKAGTGILPPSSRPPRPFRFDDAAEPLRVARSSAPSESAVAFRGTANEGSAWHVPSMRRTPRALARTARSRRRPPSCRPRPGHETTSGAGADGPGLDASLRGAGGRRHHLPMEKWCAASIIHERSPHIWAPPGSRGLRE